MLVGVAITLAPVEVFKVEAGDQVYEVLVPDAVMVELPAPEHMATEVGVTVIVGMGFTVKVTVFAALVQEPEVPFTL